MARFSLFERVNVAEMAKEMSLTSYSPEITLEGLLTGVDNLRHDVYLSPKFVDMTRTCIARLIAKYGNVEDLAKEEPINLPRQAFAPPRVDPRAKSQESGAEFKRTLTDLQVNALNVAKAEGNISLDLLARLAIVKLFRYELAAQFAQVLERCRTRLKNYEGPRSNPRGMELRDRFLNLQVSKKIVLRKAGQELFVTLREVEKETVARMRRSLFGEIVPAAYDLFLNRLLFTDEGRDDFLNAEHYVMLGNYDRDPDRFATMQEIATEFIRSLELVDAYSPESEVLIDSWLSSPHNAQELVGAGVPEEESPKGKAQRVLLNAWVERLDRAGVTEQVLASYEVVPLLAEYSALINPQQLKNALVSKSERHRVEQLLDEHSRMAPDKLQAAIKRLNSYSSGDRAKIAGRFLMDFMRYHRDLRRFEAINSAADSVNVITNEKLRELSGINRTLYEFLLPEEQKPAEDRVTHHIILKADIRDSTRLTRTLFERGLNPASYFSLNFYEPVNKLLPKYGATKVFIEGDAVILAMFERDGEASFGVARTCMLAREIIDIVRAYNEQSQRGGLPVLELGIGICYHDAPPMYLMDGTSRIMISPALNESDRLSSCSKVVRRFIATGERLFNIFSFQTVDDATTGGAADEFVLRYNIGGIRIAQNAFQKLQDEIALQRYEIELPGLWGTEKVVLHSGLVPVAGGVFHRIVVREAESPHIDPRDFSLKGMTEARYYEVCTGEAIYHLMENLLHSRPAQA